MKLDDKISDIKLYRGDMYMSTVVAMCGTNYAIMMSDGRLVSCDDNNIEFIDENFKKIIRINESLCVGVTGDASGFSVLSDVLDRQNIKNLDVAPIAQVIHDNIINIPLSILPLNILLTGKAKNGIFFIVEMSSMNNYTPVYYTPPGSEFHVTRCALPKISDPVAMQQINNRIDRLPLSNTLDEMQVKIGNLIKSVANKNKTVNKNLFCEIIL